MSATTPYYSAHVPVDEFQIINGPGPRELRKLYHYESDKSRGKDELTVTLTLKTAASNIPFIRTVRFMYAGSKIGNKFSILGVADFCDGYVNIEYDAHRRSGRIW